MTWQAVCWQPFWKMPKCKQHSLWLVDLNFLFTLCALLLVTNFKWQISTRAPNNKSILIGRFALVQSCPPKQVWTWLLDNQLQILSKFSKIFWHFDLKNEFLHYFLGFFHDFSRHPSSEVLGCKYQWIYSIFFDDRSALKSAMKNKCFTK